MEMSKKLRDVWPWLPVFRVVAETQHLPTAAKRLHVSPSALSRTIRLVEDTLEQRLFVRSSRKIVLNAAGHRLLDAVRRSTSSLEKSMLAALSRDFSGSYRVSSLGVLTDHFVLPTLLAVQREHPAVLPCMSTELASEANRQLRNGVLEVAFYYDATSHEGITCRRIGTLTNSVYCGKGHPLFGKPRVSTERLLEHEFSVAAIGDRGTPMDSWPVELPRKVGFQILMLSSNVGVALSGRFVTVLPDAVAAPYVQQKRLYRLAPNLVPDTEVYAACREEDAEDSFTSQVISRVEAAIEAAPRRKRRR